MQDYYLTCTSAGSEFPLHQKHDVWQKTGQLVDLFLTPFDVYEQYRSLFFFFSIEGELIQLLPLLPGNLFSWKCKDLLNLCPSVKFALQIDFSVWKILGSSSTLNCIYPQMHTFIMLAVIYTAKHADEPIGQYFKVFILSYYVDM